MGRRALACPAFRVTGDRSGQVPLAKEGKRAGMGLSTRSEGIPRGRRVCIVIPQSPPSPGWGTLCCLKG